MFDKAIIRNDNFLDMPPSTQNLYFHLGMEADDEGFVSPKMIMRTVGATDDELKILAAKNLVIPFESGVIVITHWKENNWLDVRRIKPTQYQEEKAQLTLQNNKYFRCRNSLSKNLQTLSQSSIEESRIEENNYNVAFERFYKEFPARRKAGKKAPLAKWVKINPSEYESIVADVIERKTKHKDWLKNDGDFIPAPEVYLNKEQWNLPIVEEEQLQVLDFT